MTTDPERQAILDQEHLRLLTLFYYIRAGITALFSCFALIYVIMGIFVVAMTSQVKIEHGEPPPALIGWLFLGIGSLALVLGLLIAFITYLAGRYISRRQNLTFCYIVAGLSCLSIPYGTLGGVLTFFVLGRPSVKRLFEPNNNPGAPAGGPA